MVVRLPFCRTDTSTSGSFPISFSRCAGLRLFSAGRGGMMITTCACTLSEAACATGVSIPNSPANANHGIGLRIALTSLWRSSPPHDSLRESNCGAVTLPLLRWRALHPCLQRSLPCGKFAFLNGVQEPERATTKKYTIQKLKIRSRESWTFNIGEEVREDNNEWCADVALN